MFDLFRSREKSVRYVLGAVLGLVALSLVITLIPGYGSGTLGGGDPQLLAEIGDDKLTLTETRQIIEQQRRANRIPPGTESIYIPLIVDQMIADRAVAYQAKRMGFDLTPTELAEAIASTVPQLYQDGKFIGRETYAAFLAQQGMTIPQFEENMRKQVASTRLESLVLEGIVVSPQEVENEFRRVNEKVKLQYFVMTPDKYRAQVVPTEAEMKAVYDQRKSAFMLPEKRSYLLFPIEEQKVAATVAVDDAALRKAYAENLDRFRTPERVRVRHILLKTTDKPAPEVEKARKRMEDLLKQARAGANFADLATKNSEDTGSAIKGGDLDWVVRGQMVPEFEKATFETKPGQISDIVTTVYGFHILKVEAREDAHVKPFEEVQGELRSEVAKAQVFDKMQAAADQIHAALVKSADEATKVAQSFGIAPVDVPATNVGDPLPGVGSSPDFQEAARALQVGGVTPVVSLGPDKLAIGKLTGIVPSRQAQMSEVMDSLRSVVVNEKSQRMYDDRVKEATERLKNANGDIASVAKQMGFELKTSDALARGASLDGVGMMVQVEEAYRKNPGETFGPVGAAGGSAFMKVVEKVPADLTQLEAQRAQISGQIKAQRARDRRELFVDGVVAELIKEKKIKKYEDNIKRLTSSYSGS